MPERRELVLIVRREIRSLPEPLFDAWTRPELLVQWWGPPGVRCTGARIDLREGGAYRIDHEMSDGRPLSIVGTFSLVERPRRLAYSWRTTSHPEKDCAPNEAREQVEVRFEPREHATEVIVVHTRIADTAVRSRHEQGWQGCLDGLAQLVVRPEVR